MDKLVNSKLVDSKVDAYSAGARYERKAILAKIRREIRRKYAHATVCSLLDDIESWILDRRKRYEAHQGGLGKKK